MSKALLQYNATGTLFFSKSERRLSLLQENTNNALIDGNNCGVHFRTLWMCINSPFLDGCIYDPDEAQRILYAYQQEHMVSSHTWSHSDLNTLNRDESVYA